MTMSRRDMMKLGALTGVGATATWMGAGTFGHDHSQHQHDVAAKSASRLRSVNFPGRYVRTFVSPPRLKPFSTTTDADGSPLKRFQVCAKPVEAQIVSGLSTQMLGYEGSVPGPIIDIDRGTHAELFVRNQLPATHPRWGHPMDLSTHLHGSASLPQYDGYASDLTAPGRMKKYCFPNVQPARTLWYHDHAQHFTAMNAYSGLAAQYHLHDEVERALLPQGAFDVPITVSDAMFDERGQLAWEDNSHSGLWGDVILVNGVPWPVMKVEPRIYRFRVLVASISRSYRFRLSNGDPVTFVATDGGLMPRSRQATSWRHAPAERYEVLIDFRRLAGRRVELVNSSNANNIDYDFTGKVMAFDVLDVPPTRTRPDGTPDPTWNTIPDLLEPSNEIMLREPSEARRVRNLRVERSNGEWTFGGTTWHDVVESGYRKVVADPDLGDTEIWEVENKSGGWFHPVHIHLVDFKVLSRNGAAPFAYEQGPKDVVYVGENEVVRLLMKFGPHRGRYMVHCHNLPHEDHDMMAQFSVGLKSGDEDPNDPNEAAKPVADADPWLA